ncbi:MAG: hypothetical protein DRJ31_09380 [Candidatus Methanomethylicota archaeon]|uniref:Uncharacterized protein n=1 Tax=Thermoproteota archaeon TaxID=2056631 RepID=A0A497EM59_9CREN|nr:MAG: hypothetical protein DRJ31_09380 [Candidatus Verstraetearchaeota archaeon]
MNEQELLELLRKHPWIAPYIEYVRPGKDGRRGYWRIKPYLGINPVKLAEMFGGPIDEGHRRRLQQMLRLAEVSHELAKSGKTRGKEYYKGVEMPRHAVEIARRLKGKHLPPRPSEAIRRLRRILRRIGEIVEEGSAKLELEL